MFTTQLAKSNTQFQTQQPGFTTFKQTQIPSYQEPLKIEQRQQTIQNQASSGLPQRQISNLFEGKQSNAFGSGIYKTQISYANVPKPAAKGILDQISDTDSQFQQQQVQEDVDMDQLSEQSKKRRRLITDKFIADDEISILSGREDQDQQMIQEDGQSIRSEQVKDVSKAKTYKQILQRGSEKMSDVVGRQDLDIRNKNQTQLLKAQEILRSIREKTQSFNEVRVFNKDIKRLSAQEAEKVFTDMGIVLPQKKLVQHSKVIPMRPIFAPNGNLITVKQNSQQVHITQIPLNSNIPLKEERQAYKNLSEVFLKHTTFKEDILDPNLGLRFDQLNLQNLGQDQLNHLVPQSFDDPYFEKLLATLKVHTLELKSNPTELFYFFEDLIIHNISQIQDCEKQISKLAPNMQAPQKLTLQSLTTLKQKLQEEFYVICTLNALYGNPCIHLVQLHHKFTGVRNYEKTKRVFGLQNDQNLMGMKASKEYDDAHTFKNEKQRRNALTEVIRFMCQQEYTLPPQLQQNPKQSDSSIVYQIAQHHLFNGDLKACLEHLNQNKKHKMAMYITQCMSSTSANDNMRDQFAHNNAFYKNFSAQAMELVNMMIGNKDLSSQLGKGQEKQWARLLCYYLTIKVKPNTEFSSLLRQFDNEVYATYEGRQIQQQQHFASNLLQSQQRQQQQQQSTHSLSLVYFLIKLYASQKQETTQLIKDHLNTFQRIKPTSLHNVQDYRLQLITVMSLYYLQRHFRMHESKYQHRVEGFVIPDTVLANCAVQYTHQLLRQGDWQQALLAAQIIPKKSIKIKKQLIFYILQVHALHLTNHTSLLSNHKYVKEKLRISKDLVHVVRAFAFQYRYHNELALNEWIECKNLVAANNILNQRILPLYFRINYQNRNAMDYLNSHEKLITDTFERLIKAQKGQVDQALILDITQNNPVYLFVTRFLSQVLKQGDKLKSEDIEKIIRDIASTLGFQEKLQTDNMQRFIWEILVEYDRLQKISNVQKQASGQLKNQYGSRASQNFEPMLELINLYAENPIIIRNLDQFTMQSLPTLICNQV